MENYFSKNTLTGPALFDAIRDACDGLVYISETDAPVVPFRGAEAPSITGKVILQQTGRNAGETIEETSFEMFFERLTTVEDWFSQRQRGMAASFYVLRTLLEKNLCGPRVFRIGRIQIQILAVGLDKDSCVMGVMTRAVET